MSTLSGLVHTSAATVTFDLIGSKKEVSEVTKMKLLKVFVLFFIIVSAGLAVFQNYGPKELTKDIASLMGISWGAISGAFIGPFFYGLYWKKTTKASVWASFIVGALVSVLGLILSLTNVNVKIQANGILWFDFKDSIYMGVLGMVLSFIIVPIVSSFTKKIDNVDEIFKCYDRKVIASGADVLVDNKEQIVVEEKIEEKMVE